MKTISILGCGFGLLLAELFIKNNYTVNGATTTSSKLSVLKNKIYHPISLLAPLKSKEID